jgi:ABC-2 type transport system ATP-binding protein
MSDYTITVNNLTKRFGSFTAVDHVSFNVNRGEVYGWLGPNGAGKTTTMRMITQYLEPDAGEIRLDGVALADAPLAAKRRIGYLAENNPLYTEMLVADYLGFIASLRGMVGVDAARALDEAVSHTGIQEVFYRPIGELSKGYRQRVGLAQAILHRPDLLVLDEPTEGLDPSQRVEIRKLIVELGRERTVMLSTHVLPEVQATCSRVLIINRGRIAADGPVDQLVLQATGAVQIAVEVRGKDVISALKELDGVHDVAERPASGDGRVAASVTADRERDVRPAIFELAKKRRWTLYELHQEARSLEDFFLELTASDREPESSQEGES